MSSPTSCLLLAALLLVSGTLSVFAADERFAGLSKQFSLKAVKDDELPQSSTAGRMQLSRSDLAAVPAAITPNPGRFSLEAGQAAMPVQAKLSGQASQEQPSASIAEYGVDWSRWISQLADHWFYNLKTMEETAGLQFNTSRSCLLQFTCYPNGAITDVTLKQSSGAAIYDRLQAQALLLCQPIAPFPAGTRRISLTLVQGWQSHPRQRGEQDFQPGSFGQGFPMEIVKKWVSNSR